MIFFDRKFLNFLSKNKTEQDLISEVPAPFIFQMQTAQAVIFHCIRSYFF